MSGARIPRTITIAGHPFTVRVARPASGALPGFSDATRDALGACDYNDGVIGIRGTSAQNRSQQRDTLLHEVVHAVFRACGFHNGGRCDLSRALDEERVVRMTSTLLLDALRRNPKLAAYLLDDDR